MCELQYAKFVKPGFEEYILPSKKYADIVIPRGGDNVVAIDLIVQHIHTKLGQHDLCKIYSNLFVIQSTFQVSLSSYALLLYCSFFFLFFFMEVHFLLYILDTYLTTWSLCIFTSKKGYGFLDVELMISSLLQIHGMHTLIRNVKTRKHDFVFYADRLIRLVHQYFFESSRKRFELSNNALFFFT